MWLVGVLFLAQPVAAHPSPFSFLDIDLHRDAVDVTLTAHVFDLAHDLGIEPMERLLDPAFVASSVESIRESLAPRFSLAVDGVRAEGQWLDGIAILEDRQAIQLRLHYPLESPAGSIEISAHMFPYDPLHQTFVNVYEEQELRMQAILDDDHGGVEYFAGSRQGVAAVVRRFLPSGIHHILIGPDHLLFLIGLLLAGGSLRRLLVMATAFTAGHSVTLALAALNIVTPPPNLIEPVIALSVVFVGTDNILKQGGRDVRAWAALAFGLVHGFGFANVLREMALPPTALGWSLFSFNVGVEFGQMLVVAAVASALAALRAQNEWAGRQVAFGGSLVVIAAGTFWFIQRLFFAGGI